MTQVSVENVTEIDKPYTNRYHLKIPGYAQRTGSRLFLQPAVFQKGIPPEFPAARRRHPVYFDYAWKEIDQVRIALPPGYELESPNAPPAASFGKVGGHSITLVKAPDGTGLEMSREFFFGGDDGLQFPVSTYARMKSFFDEVSRADGHTVTLRRAAAGDGPR
jgi:hypothetical protein